MLGGVTWPWAWPCGAAPPVAGAPGEAIEDPTGATAFALMMAVALELAMADVSGSVRVTVFGELSPTSAQTEQIFSIVVIGMMGVWMAVEPGNVQPQCVVVRVVVMVV